MADINLKTTYHSIATLGRQQPLNCLCMVLDLLIDKLANTALALESSTRNPTNTT